jgi:hypothetical protein
LADYTIDMHESEFLEATRGKKETVDVNLFPFTASKAPLTLVPGRDDHRAGVSAILASYALR